LSSDGHDVETMLTVSGIAARCSGVASRREAGGSVLALRLTVAEAADLTAIRVDGRLANDGVAELDGVCRTARRPLVLDLTHLTGGSDAGVALLRRLAGEGVHLLGASPYVALLLACATPGPPAVPPDRRRQPPVPRRRRRARGGRE